ncbi:MAG: type II toxin-antitoxin system VapC family toxin [Actinobacteria bacterium]|nr:type II toxin-antitoxin system VapC family toxin [Actinomycetota bacterium]
MIAYCDSSVLVRFILEQANSLVELATCDQLVTSVVTQVECLRAIENARLRGELSDDELAGRRGAAYARLSGIERIEVSPSILAQSERSFGVVLKTLDAIHVATAIVWRERRAPSLVFATHDRQQARAAIALGFEVLGATRG